MHLTRVDAEGAKPQHRHARDVEHEHDYGEHEGHQATGLDSNVGDVHIGRVETLGFGLFAHEGTDHADAHQLFTQHLVDAVDAPLHFLKLRNHAGHDEGDGNEQHGHGHGDEPGQCAIFTNGHDDATDGHQGSGHHHGGTHQHEHLYLLNVVS